MKKVLLVCVCTSLLLNAFAQRKPSGVPPSPEKEAYLQKSKKLWKVAIIVVSVGGAMAIAGIAVASSQANDYNYNDDNTSGVLFITGCAVMLSSLCFSIPASIAKRRARAISFKNEPSLQFQQGMVFNSFVPSLNLRIGLGKPRSSYSPLPQL